MDDNPVSAVVTVGKHQYSTWGEAGRIIDPSIFSNTDAAYIPATVVPGNTPDLNDRTLEDVINRFSGDDVWNDGFMQFTLLQKEGSILYRHRGQDQHSGSNSFGIHLSNGPYFINTRTGCIYFAARLFEDSLHAFLRGGIAYDNSTQKYESLQTTSYFVPSRLYFEPTLSQPLRGLRFAVKDVIDIAGLRTSNGSRAWLDTYPPAEESAPFVRQLTEAGATLVGKLNCTQFCDGQDPSERFEEVSPFNPRGDGYQNPSSSSSGSAAAAAGYDWLDFTIGTDTGGSIRHPAGVNGLYGIRPSFHSVDSRGMLASSFMDTVGVFARSADILEKTQKVMTSKSVKFHEAVCLGSDVRYKLMYPVRSKDADPNGYPKWFPHPNGQSNKELSQVERIFEDVVAKLEKHLDCQRQIFNMDELWATTHPKNMDGDLSKATGTIYQKLVYAATAKDVIDPFIAKYKELHDGRTPYLEPVFRRRYEYGTQVTKDEFQAAVKGFATFKTWLRNVLFASGPEEIVILLFPQSWGIPFYRDQSKATPKGKIDPGDVFWEGFSLYSISYVSGCPDITVPVGQTPYHSRITEHEEWLPVSLSVLSQPGNDLVLMNLLKELEETGVLGSVKTGRKAYD